MSDHPINSYVLARLRQIRLKRGLQIRAAADRAGIPLGSYTCLEAGRYRLNLENLYRMLHALGAGIEEVWPADPPPKGGAYVTVGYISQHVAHAAPMRPSLDDVLNAVCQEYGISLAALCQGRRDHPFGEARAVAALLTSEVNHLTLAGLARRLGRDVSSCSHGARRLRSRLGSDRRLLQKVRGMRRALRAGKE